ncbi:hypothetical protein [Halocella sp. SP3-1]|uniref:hypothetical protein n=1 Tax=Halocella sp. SP3-1 TaxID=2382161 RepID=UPI000F75859C|nr:hypothetical protein [Halocella sp. SP3-1]AZO96383.1 hypothetical protein D7D81_18290 [Halocella sp. SP3-1]
MWVIFDAYLNTNEKDLNTNKENNKATFYKILDFLTREFEKADQDMQGYLTITLKKAFPEYEEYINQTRE